jgi:DNA excision repair protein ERCC-2
MSMSSEQAVTRHSFRARVREIAEFCCRRGDLLRGVPAVRPEQGQEAQKHLQQAVPDGYRREVPVSAELRRGDIILQIAGRIDGLWISDGLPVIDEIKATLYSQDTLPDGVHAVNLAQARLYAALEPTAAAAPRVRLRLLYRQVDKDTEFIHEETIDQAGLSEWFNDVSRTYLDWLQRVNEHRQRRDAALAPLRFPWPDYRPGQRELMTHVWHTLKAGQISLVQAATGSGKTLSLLFPALKALPSGEVGQIRFLTAKTTGQRSVQQALDLLEPRPLLLSVFPGARERLCPCLATGTDAGCDRLQGYFDRLPAAREDALTSLRLDDAGLATLAARHRLCPHAFARDMAPWADLLVGDYNHEFDPAARLREPSSAPGLLLVDEAHNLAERARAMHSTRLSRGMVAGLLRCDPPRRLKTAARAVDALILESHGTDSGEPTRVHVSPPATLDPALETLAERLRDWMDANRNDTPEEVEALWFAIRSMRQALADWGPAWRFVTHRDAASARIDTWCIDPGVYLAEDFAAAAAALVFSGTLAPRALHASTLGLDRLPTARRGRDIALPHALRDTRLHACILPWRMDYRQRDTQLPRIIRLIPDLLRQRPGRWLLCGASFRLLQALQEGLGEAAAGHPLLAQQDAMTPADRSLWLEQFSTRTEALGCVISGGSFAEGLDLADTPITGIIMAGMPVPPPSAERDALAAHLLSVGLDGSDLAWTQPAIERTLQTAGRLLRRDGDRGLLVLIDARYASAGIRRRLPSHWLITDTADEQTLLSALASPPGHPPDPGGKKSTETAGKVT